MSPVDPRRVRRLAASLLVLLLGACQSNAPRDGGIPEAIQSTLREGIASQPAPQPPPAVASALLPGFAPEPAAMTPPPAEPRFSIAVKDASAVQFFMSLVEDTPHNMAVHPDVDGTITLSLKKVTIDEVMDTVRNLYGYEYERTAHGWEVLPRRLLSRIYQVNFLNMRRTGSSQTRVSSGQVSQTGNVTETVEDGAEADVRTTTSGRSARVTGTEINTLQPETSFWLELAASVQAILGDAEGRSVVVNPQSGVVVVRAMSNELREVEQFLVTAQAIAQRQVILEAKIVEVQLDDNFRQGINWAGMFEPAANKSVTIGQVGGGTILDNGVSAIRGNTGNLNPAAFAPIVGTAAGAFGGMFTLALALNDFNAFIELLDTQGTVQVLSSPRIATMNNQKAVIKVGSDEFFVTDISNTTVTGTTTTTTPSVELTPFFSGIALDVTPQISADGNVMLHIHPAISEVRDQQKVITVGDTTQTLPLALSTVRESDSIVQARSGQVVVIGGLMQDRYRDGDSDTPLSGLPGVGSVFSHKREATSKSELVILLRPVVVESGQQWAGLMQDSARRIDLINRGAREPGRYGQLR